MNPKLTIPRILLDEVLQTSGIPCLSRSPDQPLRRDVRVRVE
jgi:hypothetical protein